MPVDAQRASGSYLSRVLVDGTQPFRYRSRVRSLLGFPQDAGIQVSFAAALPSAGFVYLRPVAGELYVPDEWLAGSSGRRTNQVEDAVDLSRLSADEAVAAVRAEPSPPATALNGMGPGQTAARTDSLRQPRPREPAQRPAAEAAREASRTIPGTTVHAGMAMSGGMPPGPRYVRPRRAERVPTPGAGALGPELAAGKVPRGPTSDAQEKTAGQALPGSAGELPLRGGSEHGRGTVSATATAKRTAQAPLAPDGQAPAVKAGLPVQEPGGRSPAAAGLSPPELHHMRTSPVVPESACRDRTAHTEQSMTATPEHPAPDEAPGRPAPRLLARPPTVRPAAFRPDRAEPGLTRDRPDQAPHSVPPGSPGPDPAVEGTGDEPAAQPWVMPTPLRADRVQAPRGGPGRGGASLPTTVGQVPAASESVTELPPVPPVVVVSPAAGWATPTHAFWERRYLRRLRARILR
jgi:hypothetical protein